eukprot:322640_1
MGGSYTIHQNRIISTTRLNNWDEVRSPQNKRLLWMNGGQLALVDDRSHEIIWSKGDPHDTGAYAVLQNDGNFVLYGANGNVRWSSKTSGHLNEGPHKLKVTDPGGGGYGTAVLISDNGNGDVLWFADIPTGNAAYYKIQSVKYPNYYLDVADNEHGVKFRALRNSDKQKWDIQPIQHNISPTDNKITDIVQLKTKGNTDCICKTHLGWSWKNSQSQCRLDKRNPLLQCPSANYLTAKSNCGGVRLWEKGNNEYDSAFWIMPYSVSNKEYVLSLQSSRWCFSGKKLKIDDNKNAKLHSGVYPTSVRFYIRDNNGNKISYYDLFGYPDNGGYFHDNNYYILGLLTIALIANIIWCLCLIKKYKRTRSKKYFEY